MCCTWAFLLRTSSKHSLTSHAPHLQPYTAMGPFRPLHGQRLHLGLLVRGTYRCLLPISLLPIFLVPPSLPPFLWSFSSRPAWLHSFPRIFNSWRLRQILSSPSPKWGVVLRLRCTHHTCPSLHLSLPPLPPSRPWSNPSRSAICPCAAPNSSCVSLGLLPPRTICS